MTSLRLCVRNLPCKILENHFRTCMQEGGLDISRYQIQMPKRRARNGKWNNFGYAFVDCGHVEDVHMFIQVFQGFRFETIRSNKSLLIEPASASLHSGGSFASSSNSPWSFDEEVYTHASAPASHDDIHWPYSSRAMRRGGFATHSTSEDIPEHWVTLTLPEDTSPRDSVSVYPRIPDARELPPTRVVGVNPGIPDACELPPTRLNGVYPRIPDACELAPTRLAVAEEVV
eukprot:TRINITY_DN7740_c0_g2_i1.p1 TRINITY_DN7740_c0_g2~~TRINITY_DN7740_c0_g2_i1.p1  ORF type:complete len:230 (-),score=26.20 TRINITY_DN7740_c0_g2_i1:158-847(-)